MFYSTNKRSIAHAWMDASFSGMDSRVGCHDTFGAFNINLLFHKISMAWFTINLVYFSSVRNNLGL